MRKFRNKIISLTMALILLISHLLILVISENVYASDIQNANTNHENVKFNAYFENKEYQIQAQQNSNELKLYFEIEVQNAGYLNNGIIKIEDSNFEIDSNYTNNAIEKIESNTIYLNQIKKGEKIILDVPIKAINLDKVPENYFTKESKIKFEGKYVDSQANETRIYKEQNVCVNWYNNANTKTNISLERYIPYSVKDKSGLFVQLKIETGIENNLLPASNTKIEFAVPQINDKKPSQIKVSANTTLATNGDSTGTNFLEENWNYDEEKGNIVIEVKNEKDSNGNISWVKNSKDEYLISLIYEDNEIYDLGLNQEINLPINSNICINTYNNKATELKENVSITLKLKEKTSDIVNFEIIKNTNTIQKGQIYANYDSSNKQDKTYVYNYIANIAYADLVDYIQIEQEYDNYESTENTSKSTTKADYNNTYNKNIKINRDNFINILGEDGLVEIFNELNEKIGVINKETKTEENNYILDISNLNNNKLTIRTSKPISEGKLVFEIEKAIKGKQNYSKVEMQSFNKIKMSLVGTSNLVEETKENTIELQEPVSEAKLSISNDTLSTVIKNENVELKAILCTTNTQNSLFKNPTLQIELPEYIKNINIKEYNILFDDELKISKIDLKETNGKKVINVELQGTQTKYNTNKSFEGATIVINTDIELEPLTPNLTSQIVMKYTNENCNVYAQANNGVGISTQEVEFAAPTGVVSAIGVENYSDTEENILSMTDEAKTGIIDIYSNSREVKSTGTIINNYKNKITQIEVLGRLPFKGNKNLDTNADLGTTFDINLKSNITINEVPAENVKIYYSTNGNATKDLQNSSNAWTERPSDLKAVKSYLIVLENYELQPGSKIDFYYNMEVPANLSHNNYAYNMYKVFFKNVSDIETKDETKTSAIIGLSTGEGAELEVSLSSNVEQNGNVREYQIVKYIATVKNVGEKTAENVKINITAPEGTNHIIFNETRHSYEEQADSLRVIEVGNISKNETVKKEYEIIIHQNNNEKPVELINNFSVTADNINGSLKSADFKQNILEGYVKTEINYWKDRSTILTKGEKSEVTVKVGNMSEEETLKDIIVTIPLNEGTTYSNVKKLDNLSDKQADTTGVEINNQNLVVKIDNIQALTTKYIVFDLEIEKVIAPIKLSAKTTVNGNIHLSNEVEYQVEEVKIDFEQKAISNKNIKDGQEFKYELNIKNTGNIDIENAIIENVIPDGTKFIKAEYNINSKDQTINTVSDNKLKINIPMIKIGEKVSITVTLKALALYNGEEKDIENIATVYAKGFDKIESNKITFYVTDDPNYPKHDAPDNPSGGGSQTTSKYRITGTAWLDSNMNGKREDDEQLLSDIEVILVYKNNNQIVKDSNTNEEKRVKTDKNGKYEFTNVVPGEYLVMFIYDAGKYNITTYQAKDVDTSLNSDATETMTELNGENRIVGISDIIKVTDSSIRDIDIGLYVEEKFDLRLDKYLERIVLTTPTIGTATYDYDKEQIGKVEVLGKNLGKSDVAITYKIVVTNEGAIPGYAKKIIDYLPDEVKFSTDLNKDWYLLENGSICNTSLENDIINPGESKEISLVVTMRITESNLDILSNTAEIYEAYNEKGLKDIDSTPGNKAQLEDDMSKAEVVVSIVTGKVIMYITIILGILTILTFGIYGIKRVVLKNK